MCTATVSGRRTFLVDASARGEDVYMATRGDILLAIREDLEVATREDFLMATDIEYHEQLGIEIDLVLRTRPRTAYPFSEHRPFCKVLRSCDQRVAAHPRRLGNPGLAATAQHLHHRGRQRPMLALVEKRRRQREEPRQALLGELHISMLHRAPSPASSRRHCGYGRERLNGARVPAWR